MCALIQTGCPQSGGCTAHCGGVQSQLRCSFRNRACAAVGVTLPKVQSAILQDAQHIAWMAGCRHTHPGGPAGPRSTLFGWLVEREGSAAGREARMCGSGAAVAGLLGTCRRPPAPAGAAGLPQQVLLTVAGVQCGRASGRGQRPWPQTHPRLQAPPAVKPCAGPQTLVAPDLGCSRL